MKRHQIIAYQEARDAWLNAQFRPAMGTAEEKQQDLYESALHNPHRESMLGAIPSEETGKHYRQLAASINNMLGELFTAPPDGEIFVDTVIWVDRPHFIGQKVVRLVNTPELGSFQVSEDASDGSYKIEWAPAGEGGLPALLHTDMQGYFAERPEIPVVALQALDNQAETVSLICEDVGIQPTLAYSSGSAAGSGGSVSMG